VGAHKHDGCQRLFFPFGDGVAALVV